MTKRGKTVRNVFLILLALLAVAAAAVTVVVLTHRPDTTIPPAFDGAEDYTPEEGVYNFLVIGRDNSKSLADVIMLLHLDAENGTASLMQIPRDTYLETDKAETCKINAIYSVIYKSLAERDKKPALTSARILADCLEKTLCLKIHYCVTMDLAGFAAIIDSAFPGGITLEVPLDMDYEDPEQDLYIHLKAGVQTLHGDEACQFVRFRSGYTLADVGRVDAQKIFLSAMLKEARQTLGSLSSSEMLALADKVLKLTETDISALDASYFARKAVRLQMDAFRMMTIPGSSSRDEGGTWYYQSNRDDTLTLINMYMNSFDEEIAERIFDVSYALTNERDGLLSSIYFDESGKYAAVYTAAGIEENSIPIKTKS